MATLGFQIDAGSLKGLREVLGAQGAFIWVSRNSSGLHTVSKGSEGFRRFPGVFEGSGAKAIPGTLKKVFENLRKCRFQGTSRGFREIFERIPRNQESRGL